MIKIESSNNQKIKLIKKLEQKKYRYEYKKFVIFGDDLILEAMKKGIIDFTLTYNHNKKADFIIDEKEFRKLDSDNLNVDILAVCIMPSSKSYQEIQHNNVLILDEINDPVNSGAIYRNAAGFNFLSVIHSKNSVDIYNSKALRNSKGAFFFLDIYENIDLRDILKNLKEKGYLIIGADAHQENIEKLDLIKNGGNKKICLILGNESRGLSLISKNFCDVFYKINTVNIESLNVNSAAAIIMHDLSRMKNDN